MAYRKGMYLKVKVGGSQLVGLTSKSLSWDQDFAEVTTDDSSDLGKEHMPTFDDATIDFEGLHNPDETDGENLTDIFDKLQNNTEFEFIIGGINSGDMTLTAQGYMASISWEGSTQDAESFSGTIQRTGQFTKGTVT